MGKLLPFLVITVRTVLVIIAFVVTVNQQFVLFIFLWLCVDAVYTDMSSSTVSRVSRKVSKLLGV